MKNFLKIISVFVVLFSQNFFSQNNNLSKNHDLSNGMLNINNSEKIPVKIYSTTSFDSLRIASEKKIDSNLLIILNEDNLEVNSQDDFYGISSILSEFKKNGFIFLDKNFVPIQDKFVSENLLNNKYIFKSEKGNYQFLNNKSNIQLETKFKIWDNKKYVNFGTITIPEINIGPIHTSEKKIGPLKLHYYSLMFVLAFGIGYFLFILMFRKDRENENFLEPIFTWTLLGTILGARIGHVIFYEPERFSYDFWSVFLPIKTNPHFEFTGFSGLASHGAALVLVPSTIYIAIKILKKNPLWLLDRLAITVALAGFFIRFGNFFNSEIIGKPIFENSPLAILFPQQSSEYGVTIPRYPTQLFEAFGYLALFFVMWFIYLKTKKKYQQGWLFGFFFAVLWSIRFLVEFLKEPQGEEKIHLGILNTGQVLSIPLIIIGIICMIYSTKFKYEDKIAEN